jgi:hypothetical protein
LSGEDAGRVTCFGRKVLPGLPTSVRSIFPNSFVFLSDRLPAE